MTPQIALSVIAAWLVGALTICVVVAMIRPVRIGTPPAAEATPDIRPVPLDDLLGAYTGRPADRLARAYVPDDLEAAFARPATQPSPAWIWRCAGCRDFGFIGGCTQCGRTPP